MGFSGEKRKSIRKRILKGERTDKGIEGSGMKITDWSSGVNKK